MQKKLLYKFYLWIMGWSGTLSAWAWRKHTKILKQKQEKQHKTILRNQTNFEYLEELKRKLDKRK
jgi:hypothetical protein